MTVSQFDRQVHPAAGHRALALAVRRVLLLLAVLVSGLALPFMSGTAQAAGTYSVTNGEYVTIRTGPGTGYASLGTANKGTTFTLHCQYQNGTSVGGNRTWDKVTFSDGRTGVITDYLTSTPSWNNYAPNTDDCNKAQKAVEWANAHVGQAGYDGWCELFVERAYGTSGRYASALSAFNAQRAAGRINYTTNVPAGALAFFRNPYDGGYGHVQISRGDGTFVTTGPTVRVVNLAYSGTFLGWSYAPTSWPGV